MGGVQYLSFLPQRIVAFTSVEIYVTYHNDDISLAFSKFSLVKLPKLDEW